MIILGIDPGLSGGLCCFDENVIEAIDILDECAADLLRYGALIFDHEERRYYVNPKFKMEKAA